MFSQGNSQFLSNHALYKSVHDKIMHYTDRMHDPITNHVISDIIPHLAVKSKVLGVCGIAFEVSQGLLSGFTCSPVSHVLLLRLRCTGSTTAGLRASQGTGIL